MLGIRLPQPGTVVVEGRQSHVHGCCHCLTLHSARVRASSLSDARAATLEHVSEHHPALKDVAESGKPSFRPPLEHNQCQITLTLQSMRPHAGALLYWRRPADYRERRSDGYQVGTRQLLSTCCRQSPTFIRSLLQEPLEVYILGANHFSQASAEQVGEHLLWLPAQRSSMWSRLMMIRTGDKGCGCREA